MSGSATTGDGVGSDRLPAGTITMLFTDIEGSTRLLHEVGDQTYAALLAQHHELVIGAGRAHKGLFVNTHGDAVFMVFTSAADGVAAAVDAQRALAAHPWPGDGLRVRMGLHAGAVELRDTGYVGAAVHEAARVADAANGGQVLMSSLVADLLAGRLPAMTTLVELGLFDLRDVGRPLRLLRVRHDQLMEDDRSPRAPLRGGEPGSRWAPPVPATSLIGRDIEVAAVRRLLGQPDVRLVTLTGPGGTGKTRVALQVAAETADAYANGACFVQLAPVADPKLVPAAIGQVLDLQTPPGRSLRETLTAALRDKGRLLVLDNFEQVLPAAGFVAELLAACPRLKVLVTSRAVLHLSGEHDVPVPPLGLPADRGPAVTDDDFLAAVFRSEAVQLFAARASAATPDFTVTAVNAGHVAQICQRLDGLPLAIELAAARIRSLSPRAIVARLDQRLPLLTGGARDLPERLQTMRNAIAWSYEALSPDEQELFRRMSVFVGGCTLEAVEAVAAGDHEEGARRARPGSPGSLDVASSLVDSSVLQQIESADGEPRFWMLETLREYGLDLLEARGETSQLRRRHAEYFLALAEEADAKLPGLEQCIWYERLESEHDNLRAALSWGEVHGDPQFRLRLALALTWFWRVRSHLGEGRRWIQAALAAVGEPAGGRPAVAAADETPTSMRVRALYESGFMAVIETDYPAAIGWMEEALALARATGDDDGAAWALHGLGRVAIYFDESARASQFLEESVTLFRRAGDRRGRAFSQAFLANLVGQTDPERAAMLFIQSLGVLRSLGDSWGLHGATAGGSDFALMQGDLERAATLCRENLEHARALGSQWMTNYAVWRFACIAIAGGDDEWGVRLYAAAETVGDTIGVPPLRHVRPFLERARDRMDPHIFASTWAAGRELSLDSAVSEVISAVAELADTPRRTLHDVVSTSCPGDCGQAFGAPPPSGRVGEASSGPNRGGGAEQL